MDRLEEYIRKNRKELDKYDPSPEVWKGIWKSLHKRRRELVIWLSAAAMILIVFGTAVLFYVAGERDNYILSKGDTGIYLMKNNPDLVESQIYYTNLFNDLYKEAIPLLTGHPDIEKELLNDMSQIDSICADIRKDLRDNIDNQEVIEALINNYRIKTRILEDMLEILEENGNNTEKIKEDAI